MCVFASICICMCVCHAKLYTSVCLSPFHSTSMGCAPAQHIPPANPSSTPKRAPRPNPRYIGPEWRNQRPKREGILKPATRAG